MKRHVFQDERTDDGSRRFTSAYLNQNEELVIEIHDLGPVVERAFGASEYESRETFDADQTAKLRKALGDDLIAAIAEQFPTSAFEFAKHSEALGIGRGRLWNRIGD